jgi:TPR repeat protein
MKRTLLTIWLAAILALAPELRAEGFVDGLRAYDAGDYADAFTVWSDLAGRGDAEAEAAIAGLYSQGLGVERSAAKAAAWYRRAAKRGLMAAQMNSGDIYATGRGVKRDLVKAYLWLGLAAKQGNSWSAARRDEIAKTMSATDIAEACALAGEFKAKP